jgi:hypothetical protein
MENLHEGLHNILRIFLSIFYSISNIIKMEIGATIAQSV